MSESDNKQKNMNLFESNIDNDTTVDYKPKNINDAFEGKFLECKSEKNKKSSMNKYL